MMRRECCPEVKTMARKRLINQATWSGVTYSILQGQARWRTLALNRHSHTIFDLCVYQSHGEAERISAVHSFVISTWVREFGAQAKMALRAEPWRFFNSEQHFNFLWIWSAFALQVSRDGILKRFAGLLNQTELITYCLLLVGYLCRWISCSCEPWQSCIFLSIFGGPWYFLELLPGIIICSNFTESTLTIPHHSSFD